MIPKHDQICAFRDLPVPALFILDKPVTGGEMKRLYLKINEMQGAPLSFGMNHQPGHDPKRAIEIQPHVHVKVHDPKGELQTAK